MLTQLLRRVERFVKIKQKNATKIVKKNIKKFGKRVKKVNKRYLEKMIANSLAVKMVGYMALFIMISASYQPTTQVVDATFKSNLKLDTTKSLPVVLPEKLINIKVEPIIPPAPVVVAKAIVRNTTARERAVVVAPVAKVPDSDVKAYAKKRSDEMFGEGHFAALENLWNRESGWNYHAYNASSSACGIPQAMPCSKGGENFRNDPYKQIEWGLKYIQGRYKTPTAAWNFWNSKHWY